jgi:hypothetical protein
MIADIIEQRRAGQPERIGKIATPLKSDAFQ